MKFLKTRKLKGLDSTAHFSELTKVIQGNVVTVVKIENKVAIVTVKM